MAFQSPPHYSGRLAIELVYNELVCQSGVTPSSDYALRIKHEQMDRDVRALSHSALDNTLFCEDISRIEHLYARVGKNVPEHIRKLMSAPHDIARLAEAAEAREKPRDFHAPRIFLHRELVSPLLAVASDGNVVGFECGTCTWRTIRQHQSAPVVPAQDEETEEDGSDEEEA
jgi:hypothetical protein